jgi:hypothetical protein
MRDLNKPLNQQLYGLLRKQFGHVRVSNEGLAAVVKMVPDPTRNFEERADVAYPGEYYSVNCPHCSDTRQRLYINHLFGQRDPDGRPFHHLIHCFNEQCFSDYQRVLNFIEDLTEVGSVQLSECKIAQGEVIDVDKLRFEWPGPVVRVDRLSQTHPAVVYLKSRHFDPAVIGKFYNVHYCEESSFYLASHRLVIPLYIDKKFVGWQTRALYDPPKSKEHYSPKYWNCPNIPRASIVYNLANAARYRTAVLMEGVTDVWALGPMGCCTLGATYSAPQHTKLVRSLAGANLILVYDPEEYDKDKTQKLALDLASAFPGRFANIRLPTGTDPGSLSRKFLRSFITREALKQGVKVDWRLK